MRRIINQALVGLVASTGACHLILGLDEGLPREGGETSSCSTIADCTAKAAECRTARARGGGASGLEDAIDGAPIATQDPADCKEIVYDGAGKTKVVPASDAPDDGKSCTGDACNGTTPVHTPAS